MRAAAVEPMDSRADLSAPQPAGTFPPETARPVFCIVDPSLRDFIGHHYAYDASVARAASAAGFRAVTLAHRRVLSEIAASLAVVPCFRRDMWTGNHFASYLPRRLRTAGEILLTNHDFSRDLHAGIRELSTPPGSILFAHMVFRNQLTALAQFVSSQPPAAPLSVILLFRYQPEFYDNPISARAFRTLERAAATGRRVRLASDSARLSREIGRLTSLPIEVMPVPHTLATPVPATKEPRHRLRFVSLGNARDEKGYLEILEAIRVLDRSNELDGIEFVLQSNDAAPDVQAAIAQFSQNRPANVTLLRRALSPEEYENQLLAADVVLAPYWRSIYSDRTSGVFLEGLAAGKIVITTRDTWMSDELDHCGSGLLVEDRSPASIADAVRTVVRDYAQLSRTAEAAGAICRARHNPGALVRQASEGPAPEALPLREVRRVAILYPWEDVLDGRSGAAIRCGLLIDKLAPLVDEIHVLQDGPEPPLPRRVISLALLLLLPLFLAIDALLPRSSAEALQTRAHPRHRNVIVESVPIRIRQRLLRILFRAVFRRLLGKDAFGQEMALWFHLQRRFDPRFVSRVHALVSWADVVMLEYPFWASIVAPACRARGRKLIVSNYDVLHQQVTASAWLRRLTAHAELRGMAAADDAVCVTAADQQHFAAAGVRTTVIPNPIDMDRLRITLPGGMRLLLRQLYDIQLPPGPVCLFVGSRHPPNVRAARHVRELAARMASSDSPLAFVIAGNCTDPESNGNYIALGRVENAVFAMLYQLASVVLIPLEDGTGSSLKTIEAMGHGLPVLGTAMAFRGLDVTSDENCIIENDLARWPAVIRDLLANNDTSKAIGTAAIAVAETCDYHRVFDAYLPLLALEPHRSQPEAPATDPFQDTLLRDLVAGCVSRKHFDLAAKLLREAEAAGPRVELLQELLRLALDSDEMNAAAIAAAELSRLCEPLFPADDNRVERLQETLALATSRGHPSVALAAAAELLRTDQPLFAGKSFPSNAVMLRTLLHHACGLGRFHIAHRLLDRLAPSLQTLDFLRDLDHALDAGNIEAAYQALEAIQADTRSARPAQ